MKNFITLFVFTLLVINSKAQESFNNTNKIGLEMQLMANTSITRDYISPSINYKIGKHVIFLGYMKSINNNDPDLTYEGIKGGYQIYPHKNLKSVKVFYQAYLQYERNEYLGIQKRMLLYFGSGIDYWFNDHIVLNYSFSPAYGYETSNHPTKANNTETGWYNTIDARSSINIKYYF
ncbi:DUF481 domain-containing protein [Carboxylicivirga sp. N1Y90]|uniref:DUF481 domain-containing protein n=1 Tax=Carboxylicivirga fragile TaxID=3417571 RepID=UPI003D350D5E|nr:DUF481 domain-containing protein [Marinilabiliaceae bacterium N1Y90]